jgi:outer membrane lipoprotein SlyB
VKHEVVREGGGLGEHLAQAAVAGAVGGAAAGAGHRVADHAINKFQDRRASPRRPRTYRATPTRRR